MKGGVGENLVKCTGDPDTLEAVNEIKTVDDIVLDFVVDAVGVLCLRNHDRRRVCADDLCAGERARQLARSATNVENAVGSLWVEQCDDVLGVGVRPDVGCVGLV